MKPLALALLACALAAAADSQPVLANAAECADAAAVLKLLQSGADANQPQPDGATPLHWAVHHDHAPMVDALLRAGARPNAVNRFGVPPLAQACTQGSAAVVQLLLAAGADPHATLKGGETMLMLASRAGNLTAVQALLARDARPEARERLGQTALMWAAAEGHTPVVRALLAAGASPHPTTDSGYAPLYFAIRHGHLETVRLLLAVAPNPAAAARAIIARPEPSTRQSAGALRAARNRPPLTPLALAVQNGHFELAIALVDAGADPNDLRSGLSALHALPGVRKPDASDMSDPAPVTGQGRLTSLEFVRQLVARGANVNLRLPPGAPKQPATSSSVASPGATPLLFAADRADLPLLQLLLRLGADPLLPNDEGTTPLLAAAGVGTNEPQEEAGEDSEAVEAVKLLLDRGADINTVDQNGDTAMHGAAYAISPLVIKLLADRGADPQVWKNPNKAGGTPLYIAEGYTSRLPRPDAATIAAITELMQKAGLSTAGQRPKIIDHYGVPPPAK
ncbi:MAG: ankyrin repeat domain-containing protein [Acidobacteria bacterium]|jgi:ankyrin repeat protein|nr:ankyrin repeat domain-containing protein [Bryobacteraceae bacterium CoA2 C42]